MKEKEKKEKEKKEKKEGKLSKRYSNKDIHKKKNYNKWNYAFTLYRSMRKILINFKYLK